MEPAHAKADDGERAHGFDVLDRRVSVAQHGVPIGLGDELAGVLDFRRGVAAFEIGLRAVEQGGRHSDVAIGGKTVANRADVLVDAEDFLDDDDATLRRALRIGAIGAELVAVGGGE
jgi:hypothetical protein